MLREIIQLFVGLPVVAALGFLVPRRASRAWALWLLACLIAVNLQGIGQKVFDHYNPHRLTLFTSDNELDFVADQAGDLAGVVIDYPPKGFAASRVHEQTLTVAGTSLLLAFAVLLLLLRADAETPSPPTAAQSKDSGTTWGLSRFSQSENATLPLPKCRTTGISLQAFGLVVLLVLTAEAIIHRSNTSNLGPVAVIASGFYVSRGSRLAAKWAFALMALFGFFSFLLVALVASGEKVSPLRPDQAPWAITIGLALAAWAAMNLFLTVRLLARSDISSEPVAPTDTVRNSDS